MLLFVAGLPSSKKKCALVDLLLSNSRVFRERPSFRRFLAGFVVGDGGFWRLSDQWIMYVHQNLEGPNLDFDALVALGLSDFGAEIFSVARLATIREPPLCPA